MGSWIWFLIPLIALVLSTRVRHGARAMGRGHGKGIGSHRKPVPDKQPQTAVLDPLIDSTPDIPNDPSLENSSVYKGEIYFFCSMEDRDTFAAGLDQFGEYHSSETSSAPRAIERSM